jgi:hypothetical protein
MNSIKVTLSEEDIYAKYLDLFINTKWGREYLKRYLTRVFAYIIFVSIFIGVLLEGVIYFIFALIILLFLYLLRAKFQPINWAARKQAKTQIQYIHNISAFENQLETRLFEITETHLIIEHHLFRCSIKWEYFEDLKMTSSHIIIYDYNKLPLVIPKSSFDNDTDIKSFYDTISTFI